MWVCVYVCVYVVSDIGKRSVLEARLRRDLMSEEDVVNYGFVPYSCNKSFRQHVYTYTRALEKKGGHLCLGKIDPNKESPNEIGFDR